MKYLFLSLALLAASSTMGQVKVVQGSNSPEFTLTKQPLFTSYAADNGSYFIIRNKNKVFEKLYTLIRADKSGTIVTEKEVKINAGVINNSNDLINVVVTSQTPIAFIENHNKESGKNTVTAALVDENGNVSSNVVTIGSFSFTKMSNPGNWYASVTPDGKHIAVIGKTPHEKNTADQFSYVLLDENLKETGKGQFAFTGNTNEIQVASFMASDKGDLYIISDEYDKSYTFPMLYKYTMGGAATIIPVMIADPAFKNLSYTCSIAPGGDLLIAGYMQKKKTFSANDPEAVGTWLFTSAKPSEVKTFNSDKPVPSLTARNIVYNGDTFFLVGEQYKAEKEQASMGSASLSMRMMEGNYTYSHNDIMVTGFSTAGFSKKFEISMSRKWSAKNMDQELMVASGIVNNKLALVYNDEYGKYVDDKYHRYNKLPVAVAVTNDGLMEAPVPYAKELDVLASSYILLPQYFVADHGKLVVLSANPQSVKTVTFQ